MIATLRIFGIASIPGSVWLLGPSGVPVLQGQQDCFFQCFKLGSRDSLKTGSCYHKTLHLTGPL